jgi:hypothetical protein
MINSYIRLDLGEWLNVFDFFTARACIPHRGAALECTPVKYASLCFLRNNLTGQAEITENKNI